MIKQYWAELDGLSTPKASKVVWTELSRAGLGSSWAGCRGGGGKSSRYPVHELDSHAVTSPRDLKLPHKSTLQHPAIHTHTLSSFKYRTGVMVSQRLRLLGALLALAIPTIHLLRRITARRRKLASAERVLILGASSGVGHAIARQYARRGAKVCVVARRADKINSLAAECNNDDNKNNSGRQCIGVAADLSVVADMVRLRETIDREWGGLDTIHVVAGVSALQPVMALTGVEGDEDAGAKGIQDALDVTEKAVQGNLYGPMAAALTFVSACIELHHLMAFTHGLNGVHQTDL